MNHPCDYNDPECAATQLKRYSGSGNVLVGWEHGYLRHVAEQLGASDVPKYPSMFFIHCEYNIWFIFLLANQLLDESFDLIYTLPPPYTRVTVSSEKCPGLDN